MGFRDMSRNKKAIRWLYEELPGLVDKGIIPAESEEKIRAHYGKVARIDGKKVVLTVFSIIGAMLVGGGTILILAHNWADMPRFVRTVLSFLPLVIAQALSIYVLLKRRDSTAWKEGCAMGLSLSVAASIGLVAQTYHIPGDLGNFLLTWMLLSIPGVYIFNATATAVLYLVCITWWSGYAQFESDGAPLFWLLLAAVVPHIFLAFRKNASGVRACLLGWVGIAATSVATGIVLEKMLPGLWIIIYCSLFAVYYMAGSLGGEADGFWKNPFRYGGAIGIGMLSLLLTCEFAWDDVGWGYYRNIDYGSELAAVVDYAVLAMLLGGTIVLLAMSALRKRRELLFYGSIPVLAVVSYTLASFLRGEGWSLVLFNAYAATLGVATVADGVRRGKYSKLNAGMLLISVLIIIRFFDSEFSLVARGIAFIFVGAGFFTANLFMSRYRKSVPETGNAMEKKE